MFQNFKRESLSKVFAIPIDERPPSYNALMNEIH